MDTTTPTAAARARELAEWAKEAAWRVNGDYFFNDFELLESRIAAALEDAEKQATTDANAKANIQYQMALTDIGRIGEALGMNTNKFMTHSPQEVSEMIISYAGVAAQQATEVERKRCARIARRHEHGEFPMITETIAEEIEAGAEGER